MTAETMRTRIKRMNARCEKRLQSLAVAVFLIITTIAVVPIRGDDKVGVDDLIARGEYTAAEKLLDLETDASTPITSEAAIKREILRRTRQDFRYSNEQILRQLKQSIPDVSQADIDRWRKSGDLQARLIDGEPRYFREAAANLFRASDEARRRRPVEPAAKKKFDLNSVLEDAIAEAEKSGSDKVFPVKHRVRYEVVVNDDHPRLKPGAVVRAWLPFPQEYRQQQEVKLIRTDPPHVFVAENGSPHRSIYFEQTLADPIDPPRFVAEYEFTTSAFVPKLDPKSVEPYDTVGDVYREYTAERPPHILITPAVKSLAAEIVGDEKNPLEKARRVFRWVSQNIPWCSEMEYGIISNISEKGLTARRGDCGVQGLVFVTLCRAAGVPARWQSGWQTKPGDWNMHDWSEFYVEPWGWLPADASYGVRDHADPRVKDFLCGGMDPYRLIVNLDYARPLTPQKTSFRSEPNDFQRGEVEIDGHNLYFDEWDYTFDVKTTPHERDQE
jgi:transglutaminase-like putative cysteine protease